MLQGSQTKGGPVQLSSAFHETGNNQSDDIHDNEKMKLSNDSDQHEEGQDQEWNGSAKNQMTWPIREKRNFSIHLDTCKILHIT